jgi:DNA-directed RNA polymerase specialized sigma24 family protein
MPEVELTARGSLVMDNASVSDWILTEEAFAKFLAYLDPDKERAGERYEALRLTLVKFFDWRGAYFPEECADETFNRVVRKIDSGEEIRDISTYCNGVARMIFLESTRSPEHKRVSLDALGSFGTATSETEEPNSQRDCFEDCLKGLPEESRQLILRYYESEKRGKIDNRLLLAERLGIPLNALRSRAQRVRAKLEQCVNGCTQRS